MTKVILKRKHRQLCVGDLNKRIQILDRNLQAPKFNKVDPKENFSGTKEVWTSIVTTSGQTIFVVNQDLTFTHTFSIRFDSQVTSEKWIKYKGDFYKILDIQNLEERNEWLVMKCVKRGDADLEAAQA